MDHAFFHRDENGNVTGDSWTRWDYVLMALAASWKDSLDPDGFPWWYNQSKAVHWKAEIKTDEKRRVRELKERNLPKDSDGQLEPGVGVVVSPVPALGFDKLPTRNQVLEEMVSENYETDSAEDDNGKPFALKGI